MHACNRTCWTVKALGLRELASRSADPRSVQPRGRGLHPAEVSWDPIRYSLVTARLRITAVLVRLAQLLLWLSFLSSVINHFWEVGLVYLQARNTLALTAI